MDKFKRLCFEPEEVEATGEPRAFSWAACIAPRPSTHAAAHSTPTASPASFSVKGKTRLLPVTSGGQNLAPTFIKSGLRISVSFVDVAWEHPPLLSLTTFFVVVWIYICNSVYLPDNIGYRRRRRKKLLYIWSCKIYLKLLIYGSVSHELLCLLLFFF